jgi:hypothetical protein
MLRIVIWSYLTHIRFVCAVCEHVRVQILLCSEALATLLACEGLGCPVRRKMSPQVALACKYLPTVHTWVTMSADCHVMVQ